MHRIPPHASSFTLRSSDSRQPRGSTGVAGLVRASTVPRGSIAFRYIVFLLFPFRETRWSQLRDYVFGDRPWWNRRVFDNRDNLPYLSINAIDHIASCNVSRIFRGIRKRFSRDENRKHELQTWESSLSGLVEEETLVRTHVAPSLIDRNDWIRRRPNIGNG
jgi:hypothetical protein